MIPLGSQDLAFYLLNTLPILLFAHNTPDSV